MREEGREEDREKDKEGLREQKINKEDPKKREEEERQSNERYPQHYSTKFGPTVFSRDNHTNSEYQGQFLPPHQKPWVRGYLVSSLVPRLSWERRKESVHQALFSLPTKSLGYEAT